MPAAIISVYVCLRSLTDQLEWVFADAGLVPLLVQENYVNHSPDLTRGMAGGPVLVSLLWSICFALAAWLVACR